MCLPEWTAKSSVGILAGLPSLSVVLGNPSKKQEREEEAKSRQVCAPVVDSGLDTVSCVCMTDNTPTNFRYLLVS